MPAPNTEPTRSTSTARVGRSVIASAMTPSTAGSGYPSRTTTSASPAVAFTAVNPTVLCASMAGRRAATASRSD
jgi:hypothetical protein